MARDDDSGRLLPHPKPWPERVDEAIPGAHMPSRWADWKVPKGTEPSARPLHPVDADAVALVRDEILSDLRVLVNDLEVRVHEGRLRIEGRVPNEEERRKVLHKAGMIVGAQAVDDALLGP